MQFQTAGHPNAGGIYWGRITPDVVKNLSSWSVVGLNDSQLAFYPEIIPQLKDAGVILGFCVNGLNVFVDRHGAPSTYWPMQGIVHLEAAKRNAWLMSDGKPVQILEPNGTRLQYLDFTDRGLADLFAHECATRVKAYRADFLFVDEGHWTLAELRIRFPHLNRTDQEWRSAMAYLFRRFAVYMGGRPCQVVVNGTLNPADSLLVTGHFWQGFPGMYPDTVMAQMVRDREHFPDTLQMVHATPPLTPGWAAALAALVGGVYQFTPYNGNWTLDEIPQAPDFPLHHLGAASDVPAELFSGMVPGGQMREKAIGVRYFDRGRLVMNLSREYGLFPMIPSYPTGNRDGTMAPMSWFVD